MSTFEDKVNLLVKKSLINNGWRQTESFNLIPSENTPSPLVKLLEISDPAGRYAEHSTVRGQEVYYYQGIDLIRWTETELIKEMAGFLGASRVEPRPTSGNMANMVLYQALVKHLGRKIDGVLNNELVNGGHLSAQPMGALFGNVELDKAGKEKIVNFPVDTDNPYKTDKAKLADLVDATKPELIIFGKSMFLFPEPVRQVSDLVKDMNPRPVIMYDGAHVLGLLGSFQDPFAEGANFVTGSTHKTFFGSQRGVVASRFKEGDQFYDKLWNYIKSRSFPGSTSNHHLGTLIALLMATYEMNEFKDAYQTQVRRNAKAFARALKTYGIQVEGGADGFTESHQVVINVRQYGNGQEIAKRLERNNIITNFQALPYDKSFSDPSGIRMGVQEMTRYGMKEQDFEQLAVLVADSIKGKDVKDSVSKYRKNFVQMQYTIDAESSARLATRLLSSILPDTEYARRFADNFMQLVHAR